MSKEKPRYGEAGNPAWEQYLYLQEKTREAKEAREKQVADAERWVREMNEENKTKKDFYVISYKENYLLKCNVEEFERGKFYPDSLLKKYGNYIINAIYDQETKAYRTLYKVENEIWRLNQHVYFDRETPLEALKDLFFKDSIRFIQCEIISGETPPLERRNFNSKENFMSKERQEISDQVDDYLSELEGTIPITQEQKELSPEEKAFRNAVIHATHQRKVVADAIKAGALCCLPGADGYADTTPAINIITPNKPYHGENLLFLKAFQKQDENKFPTAEYVTYHQIDKAREEGLDLYIRQGQKGVSLLVSEQNKETGEWENKNIKLFNVAQLNNPKAIKKWAEKKIEEQEKKNLEYLKTQYGANYTPPEKQKENNPAEIICSSTEPEKYLGQYLAAVSFGSKFKVNSEQAKEFSDNMISALYKQMEAKKNEQTGEIKQPPINKTTGQPITDPFSLNKISRDANAECRQFMTQTRMEAAQLNQPEQKQEQQQTQSRGGRSM